MRFRYTTALIILIILTTTGYSQTSELFPGASKLASCKVDIPLTYKKKDRERYIKGATENKNIELVLLKYNKRTKKLSCAKYYLDVYETANKTFVIAEKPENHIHGHSPKIVEFIDMNPKYDCFYKAKCFKEILSKNKELRETIKM